MLQVAETLKDAYAKLLQMKGQGALRHESILPASKEKIKAALILVAFWHKRNGSLDKVRFGNIQVCYGFLADFVSDEVAEKSRQFSDLVRDADSAKKRQEDPNWLAGEILKTEIPIESMKSSTQEFSRLCEEFNHRLNALDDPARKGQEFAVIRKALLGE